MSKGPDEAISLFPFMSILACLIGTLTMMIAGLALQQGDHRSDTPVDPATIERANAYQALQRQLAAEQAALIRLAPRLEKAAAEAQAIARLKSEIESDSKSASDSATDRMAEAERLKQQLLAAMARLEMLRQELAAAKLRNEMLQTELARLQKSLHEATVVIRPSGTGAGLEATFVECRAEGLVLLDSPETPLVRLADLQQSEPFQQTLNETKARPNGTLVFLMRDDGLNSYAAAAAHARHNLVRNGKLPVIGHGKIDLSLFRK